MLCISYGPHIAAVCVSHSRPAVLINVQCVLCEVESEFFLKELRRFIQTSKCVKLLQSLPSTALIIHNRKNFRPYVHYAVDNECYNTTK